jgi:acyl carrier protein
LSSLLHLITPCPQYSVLQITNHTLNKRSASSGIKNFFAGIRDLKTISVNSTLAELGMDSMTAVEIKETLEREFEVYLTPQEIRNLTFASLDELSAANQCTEVDKRQLECTHTILF